MTRYVTVTPAYGRDYTSQAKVRQAWADGLDFLVNDFALSGYITKDEAAKAGLTINLRYAGLTKVVPA